MTVRYKSTLGFIECVEDQTILLLNRQKSPHMGRWNGVGGKLEENESPMDCIIRETQEETGLHITNYKSRGVLRWFRNNVDLNGVYMFTGSILLEERNKYKVQSTREGVLEFKKREWIFHPENLGIVDNVKIILEEMFNADEDSVYVAEYTDFVLDRVYKSK